MNNNIFRPVEFWKSAVMAMPDSSFYELIRSVFGRIKTPFNKQQLLNDLESFLLRDDIQKNISAYIDENDVKIIAAITLFNEPVPEQLEKFFVGEYSFARIHDLLVNLEERFIVYRFIDQKAKLYTGSRLALNPVLQSALLPFTSDTSLLFPAVDKSTAVKSKASVKKDVTEESADSFVPNNQTAFNDLTIAGFYSFVLQWESFYKTEGVIRKKVLEALKTCFPCIIPEDFICVMLILGLFYIEEDRLVPDRKHINSFGLLSARERSEYCTAALLACNDTPPSHILPPLYQKKLRETTNFIHVFLEILKTENLLYPASTLRKIIEVYNSHINTQLNCEILLNTLEKTGLIENTETGLRQLGATALDNKSGDESSYEQPVISIDSGFSILVYPEITFADAIRLASIMDIRDTGMPYTAPIIRFELNRDAAVNAFNNNITADIIIELLKKLSGKEPEDVLVWNLKDWEKRHKAVSLKKGVVLSLSEEYRYLTETKLAKLIIETLAPGLYLLGEDSMDHAAAVLRSAGIEIIAFPPDSASGNQMHGRGKKLDRYYLLSSMQQTASLSFSNHFPSLAAAFKTSPFPFKITFSAASGNKKNKRTATHDSAHGAASALNTKFHGILEKMPLSNSEKQELSSRIDRRLILCETQLKEASLRLEKLEARYMDYAGKQNVAKQAISQKSPVEIIWLKQGSKDEEKIFGVPKALDKTSGDLILVEHSADGSDYEIRIPLGKISLLRRIKNSIFEK